MTSLTFFPVTGDYRNVSDPDITGSTNDPEIEIVSGFVTFYPRLPDGFTVFIDDFDVVAAQNEVQRVTVQSAAAGTFTLTFNGQTTAAIPYNATPTQVRTALEALSNIGAGNVAVTGDNGGPWYVEFKGSFASSNVATLTASGAGLSGTAPNVLITTTTQGTAAVNEIQTVTITGSPTGGNFTLTYAGQVTALIPRGATGAQVQAALEALPNIGVGNVSVAGSANGPWTVTFVGELGGRNIWQMNASNANLVGGSAPDVVVATTTQGVKAVNEQQRVIVDGAVGGTFTLTFNGQTTAPIQYAASTTTVRGALEALSNISDGDVLVTGLAGSYNIYFVGGLAGTNVTQLTANTSLLVGPSAGVTVGVITTGNTAQQRPTAIAFPPRKARIWEGVLSTINVDDTPGVDLVANSAALKLHELGYDQLIYDVQFSSVVYAEGSRTLQNFAFVAPYDSTPVVLSRSDLPKLSYQGPL